MSRKTSITLMGLSMGSFAGYLSWQMFSVRMDVSPIAYELMALLLLLGIAQHYVYTLILILMTPENLTRKLFYFSLVLVVGHFGSWIYTIAANVKKKKKTVPKTEKMEMELKARKIAG